MNSKKKTVKKTAVKKRRITVKQEADDFKQDSDSTGIFTLPSVMSINTAEALKDDLLKLSNQDGAISIDASMVEMADTASFQILLALKHQLTQVDREISWHQPSDKFLHDANTLGLSSALGLK